MTSLAARFLAAALATLALVAAVQYVRSLQADLVAARKDAQTALQGNTDRDQTIKELRESVRTGELARAKLEGERNGIRALAAAREQTFRRLIDENKEIREWANAAVPEPIVRLREHGPITGAAAYREAAAVRDALRPSGSVGHK